MRISNWEELVEFVKNPDKGEIPEVVFINTVSQLEYPQFSEHIDQLTTKEFKDHELR